MSDESHPPPTDAAAPSLPHAGGMDSSAAAGEGQRSTEKRLRAAERPPIPSFDAMLRAAYPAEGKPLYPKASELAAVKATLAIPDDVYSDRLKAASQDVTLEQTRALLMYAVDKMADSVASSKVVGFARQVLARHPAFKGDSFQRVFQHEGGHDEVASAVAELADADYSGLRFGEPGEALDKNAASSCRLNALAAFLLWAFEARGLDVTRVLRLMRRDVWLRPVARGETDRRRLLRLLAVRDGAGVGLVYDLLQRDVAEALSDAAAARRIVERLTTRVTALETAVQEESARADRALERVRDLTEEVAAVRQAHADEVAHLRDDYEALRGRLLQRLRAEVGLLAEGLVALRRNPPKVDVMDDHADRALDGLKSEIQHLRGAD